MVQSNWGDWFLSQEVEASNPDELAVWYLGCNGFIVRSPETTLYIDPYFGNGDPPWTIRSIPVPLNPNDVTLCDGVLVTHEHLDHMHPPSYGPILENTGAMLYAPLSGYENPDYDGNLKAPKEQRQVVEHGSRIEFEDLTVHVRRTNDPDAIESVGYVIEHESGIFFNAGDARPGEEFSAIGDEFDIDAGSLAFGSQGFVYVPDQKSVERVRWYQDENQVIESAMQLGLDRVLPCHYDMWKNVGADPKSLHEHASSHAFPKSIEVIQIGDRVNIDEPGVVPLKTTSPKGDNIISSKRQID